MNDNLDVSLDTYKIWRYCTNCDYAGECQKNRGDLIQKVGHLSMACSRCGCRTLREKALSDF